MIPTFLAEKNKHIRDESIKFDEGPHIYHIDGDSSFTSVTTWNHSHFEKFNSDNIIDKMMNEPISLNKSTSKHSLKTDSKHSASPETAG